MSRGIKRKAENQGLSELALDLFCIGKNKTKATFPGSAVVKLVQEQFTTGHFTGVYIREAVQSYIEFDIVYALIKKVYVTREITNCVSLGEIGKAEKMVKAINDRLSGRKSNHAASKHFSAEKLAEQQDLLPTMAELQDARDVFTQLGEYKRMHKMFKGLTGLKVRNYYYIHLTNIYDHINKVVRVKETLQQYRKRQKREVYNRLTPSEKVKFTIRESCTLLPGESWCDYEDRLSKLLTN